MAKWMYAVNFVEVIYARSCFFCTIFTFQSSYPGQAMEENRVKWYYEELKRFYLKTDSDWTDKAKSFRTIADDFYHEVSGIAGTFHEVLIEFYRWNREKVIADAAFSLKERLNDIVHHNRTVDRIAFMTYYNTLVRLIFLSTGVYPDSATEEFLGVKTEDRLSGLNAQQKDAVLSDAQIIYVSAGPGTGKTYLLVNKLVQYIETSDKKERIVALSYTNTAAKGLGEKFYGKVFACRINKPFDFYNGTIHAFCFKMLKSFYANIGKDFNYIIIDDVDIKDLAEELSVQLDMKYSAEDIAKCLKSRLNAKQDDLRIIIDEIKEKYNIISIEDILYKFIDALSDRTFIEWFREQVSILVVDEAQDLGALNYEIFNRMMAVRPDLKVFLVGDPRQNIFGFIGGSYLHLEEFLRKHGNYTQKTLSLTYRCPEAVNTYVNRFRFDDCENIPIKSDNGNAGHLEVTHYPDVEEEAKGVLDSIRAAGALRNSAVLCNSLYYVKTFIEILGEEKVPYKVFGGQKLVKPHIKILNHLLRIIDSDNEYSIRQIANIARITLSDYKGSNVKERFYATPIGHKIASIQYNIKTTDRAVNFVIQDAVEIIRPLIVRPNEYDEVEDFNRFMEIARGFESLDSLLLAFAIDKETFAPFYEKNYVECEVPIGNDWLTISTIHSAKGLEWENVFVVGLSEGIFPNEWFVRNDTEEKKAKYFNESMKAMYVAATRTKESLYLSYPDYNQYGYRVIPSRYILI